MSKTTKKGKDKKAKKVRQVAHLEPGLNAWVEGELKRHGGISFSAYCAMTFSRIREEQDNASKDKQGR